MKELQHLNMVLAKIIATTVAATVATSKDYIININITAGFESS